MANTPVNLSVSNVTSTSARLLWDRGVSFLLDSYPGATLAYSLRRLSRSSASAIRVRRTSDNAEQDIGFDGGNLDTSSLLSFVGAADGRVVIIYDQSGNADHISNLTQSEQFFIVKSGSVTTQLGIPYIATVGPSRGYKSSTTPSNQSASFNVVNTNFEPTITSTIDDNARIFSSYAGTGGISNEFLIDATASDLRYFDGASVVSSAHTKGLHIISTAREASTISLYEDGALKASASSGTGSGVNPMVVGEDAGGTINTEQPLFWAETIYYGSDKSADRAAIDAEINAYYGIY